MLILLDWIKKHFFKLFLVTTFIFMVVLPSINITGQIDTNNSITSKITTNQDNLQPRFKEVEDIEEFETNPTNTYMYDITDTTQERIQSGNLVLDQYTNTSGSNTGYYLGKELRSEESTIYMRSKGSTRGNQSEFFKDVVGDPADFEEQDTEGFSSSASSLTVSNGILTSQANGGTTGYRIYYSNSVKIGQQTQTTVKFKFKSNETDGRLRIYVYDGTTFYQQTVTSDGSTVTDWTEYEVTITNTNWLQGLTATEIGLNIDSLDTALTPLHYIDYFQILGSYDFATHEETTIEDTWDWEDSKEMSFYANNNITDFNDGSLETVTVAEGWVSGGSCFSCIFTTSNYNNEYLRVDVDTDPFETIDNVSITTAFTAQSGSTYNKMAFEFNSYNITINTIRILYGLTPSTACSSSAGWSSNTWQLFTCDMSWTGSQDDFTVYFDFTNTGDDLRFDINMFYIYDTALGDLENYAIGAGSSNLYVNPSGYLKGRVNLAGFAQGFRYNTPIANPDIFCYFTVKLKASATNNFRISNSASSIFYTSAFSVTTSFTTFTFNLCSNSDWTAQTTGFLIRTEGVVGVEFTTEIDYVLLTADTQESTFTLGLQDSVTDVVTVNVTTTYYNTSIYGLNISLLASDQSSISAFYGMYFNSSETSTTCFNSYCVYTVTYDVSRSLFSVTITDFNLSQVLDIDYPTDFTVIDDSPLVFAYNSNPKVFLQTITPYMANQLQYWDYLEAEFVTDSWIRTTNDNELQATYNTNNPLSQSWQIGSETDPGVSQDRVYRRGVKKLDHVSGKIFLNGSNNGFCASAGGGECRNVYTGFALYAVNNNNSGLYEIIRITLLYDVKQGQNGNITITIEVNDTSLFSYLISGIDGSDTAVIDYTIGLRNQRTVIDASFGVLFEGNASLIDKAGFFTETTFDLTTLSAGISLSNTFVMETFYSLEYWNKGSGGVTDTLIFYFGIKDLNVVVKDLNLNFPGVSYFPVIPFNPFGDGSGKDFGYGSWDPAGWVADMLFKLADWIVTTLSNIFVTATAEAGKKTDDILKGIGKTITDVATYTQAMDNTLDLINDTLNAIATSLSNIEGYLDGVEGLLTGIDSVLDNMYVSLTNIGLYLDGVETLLTGIDTVLDNIYTFLTTNLWTGFLAIVGSFMDNIYDWFVTNIVNVLSNILINGIVSILNSLGLSGTMGSINDLLTYFVSGTEYGFDLAGDFFTFFTSVFVFTIEFLVLAFWVWDLPGTVLQTENVFDGIEMALRKGFIDLIKDIDVFGWHIPIYLWFLVIPLTIALGF